MKRIRQCAIHYTLANRHLRKITQGEAMCFALFCHLKCRYPPEIEKRWKGYMDQCPLSKKIALKKPVKKYKQKYFDPE